MKIVSKRVETEAKRWQSGYDGVSERELAEKIVRWVIANGGEAKCVPDGWRNGPCIVVRTDSRWSPVPPGWWVIRGSETFHEDGTACDAECPCPGDDRKIRDFYPCDPDTFAQRWDIAGDPS